MSVLPRIAQLGGVALDILFPRWCVGCGREGDFLCDSCRGPLSRIEPPLCPRCGRPQPDGLICSGCVDWAGGLDAIRSPFKFDDAIRQAVYQLKYENLRALAGTLAQLLADYLIANPVPGDVLVPVPLHRKRLRERGYNQSALLAQELGKIIRLPVVTDCLVRQRYAKPQVRAATVNERKNNVAGAFSCLDRRLQDKRVIVIDDVSTSGSTLHACADALKAGGATSVWGLTLTREI